MIKRLEMGDYAPFPSLIMWVFKSRDPFPAMIRDVVMEERSETCDVAGVGEAGHQPRRQVASRCCKQEVPVL